MDDGHNKPHPLTADEIREIADLAGLQSRWGACTPDELVKMLTGSWYTARFDYVTGGLGYVGDYFVVIDDALSEPVTIRRNNRTGKLQIVQGDR